MANFSDEGLSYGAKRRSELSSGHRNRSKELEVGKGRSVAQSRKYACLPVLVVVFASPLPIENRVWSRGKREADKCLERAR